MASSSSELVLKIKTIDHDIDEKGDIMIQSCFCDVCKRSIFSINGISKTSTNADKTDYDMCLECCIVFSMRELTEDIMKMSEKDGVVIWARAFYTPIGELKYASKVLTSPILLMHTSSALVVSKVMERFILYHDNDTEEKKEGVEMMLYISSFTHYIESTIFHTDKIDPLMMIKLGSWFCLAEYMFKLKKDTTTPGYITSALFHTQLNLDKYASGIENNFDGSDKQLFVYHECEFR